LLEKLIIALVVRDFVVVVGTLGVILVVAAMRVGRRSAAIWKEARRCIFEG